MNSTGMPDLGDRPRVPLPKCPTGIDGFDEITDGGLPAGRPTLVCGPTGAGKSLFALQFLVNGAVRYSEPGVLLSFEENRERAHRRSRVTLLRPDRQRDAARVPETLPRMPRTASARSGS